MATNYPANLPQSLATTRASTVPAFGMARPRRGTPFAEPRSTQPPTIYDVEWLVEAHQAAAFRDWVFVTLQDGLQPFRIPLRTEEGLQVFLGRFMPGGLLDRQRIGTLWRYRATLVGKTIGPFIPPPVFADVGLLLHFDVILGGPGTIDSSLNNRTVTLAGGATIQATNAVFGPNCMRTTTGNGRAIAQSAAGLSFGTGDFTVEGWTFITNADDFTVFAWAEGAHTGRWYFAKYPTDNSLYVQFNGADAIKTANNVVPINQPCFIQWIREAGVSVIAVNGAQVYSGADPRNYQVGATFTIGGAFGGSFTRYFEDWRVTVGKPQAIEVPTAPFPDS